MGKFITIHSFKGGTGKSYLSVNLSTIYALRGKKIALLDLDFRAPTLYEVFGNKTSKCYINNVLDGTAAIEDCLVDCSNKIENRGKLYVGFADFSTDAIREMVSKGRRWEIEALRRLLMLRKKLIDDLQFDYVIADTSPGILYLSINAVVAADIAVVVSTLDDSDINGTQRMLHELYEIFEKKTFVVVNKAIGLHNEEKQKIIDDLSKKYRTSIIGVLPCMCDVGALKRSTILAIKDPNHPFIKMIDDIATKIENA